MSYMKDKLIEEMNKKPKLEVLRSMWIQWSPEFRKEMMNEYEIIEITDENHTKQL